MSSADLSTAQFVQVAATVANLLLVAIALAQLIALNRQHAVDREAEIALKDAYLRSDGLLVLWGIANLGNYPIVLRYASVHDASGKRLAEAFLPLVALRPGQVRVVNVETNAATGPELYSFDRGEFAHKGGKQVQQEASAIRLVFNAGRNAKMDFHVVMPRYRNRKGSDEPVFGHAHALLFKVPSGRGLTPKHLLRADSADPRLRVRPFRGEGHRL